MKKKSHFSRVLGLAVALAVTCAVSSPTLADIYVMESSAASIKVGIRIADSEQISIPAGSQVRVILPSGKTQTIKGPYSGSVADLVKGERPNPGVMAWIKGILQTGGATEATPGATRSIRMEPVAPRVGFSWVAVPVHADSVVCVQKGAKLQLVRGPSSREDRVAVIDSAGSDRGEAQWAAGSDATPWPDGLTPRADGVYYLVVQDRPRRQVTLRVLDRLPAEDNVLAELEARGCKYQFEAWVKAKMAAAARSPQ